MKNCRLLALAFALAGSAAAAQPPSDPLQALQALGVQIKTQVGHANGGKQPESKALADIEHTLMRLRESAAGNAQLQRKYQAVALLFGNLKLQTAHPARAPAKPEKKTRAQVDVEVVTDQHGASCANALGISENLPVQLMLGQAGGGRSDAWFRFEARSEAHVRFTTESAEPDPALEVFNGCGPAATKIASNDDALGLDASLSVPATSHQTVFVHLTNSGQGGRVQVAATATNATVSGSVKDAKTGFTIDTASVQLFDSNGYYTGYFVYTDASGHYSMDVDIPGEYYARADTNYSGGSYLPELYPAGICWPGTGGISSCDLSKAHTVSVASGATISGINFSLSKGQKITGQVRSSSNQPLTSAVVFLFSDSGYNETTYTDNFGRYVFSTLPAGSYKAQATASGYGWQMFNHVTCGGSLQTQCDLDQAASLLISNQDIAGVNFDLPQLAAVQGTVMDANSTPLNFAQVNLVDTNGNSVVQGYSDSSGHYIAGPLPIGNYRVYASSAGYFSQVFDGIDCASNCNAEIAGATPIAISTYGQQGQADFHLSAVPDVHGHVQDAMSGQPLANVSILVSVLPPATFQTANSAFTDANGDYTLLGTPPGTYYVWALSDDHLDQVYSGVACEDLSPSYYNPSATCDVSNATLLTIALGQTPGAFDFALAPSSNISGQAITRGSDFPAPVFVTIYDTTGSVVAQAAPDATGDYVVNDLPSGTYFADSFSSYSGQYIEQLWQHIDCISLCAPTSGTQIPVAANTSVQGIDFNPIRLDAIVGRITNALAAPIPYAVVDLFDTADSSYSGSALVDAQGYYLASGYGFIGHSYFVATEAGQGYIDQVYSGISCPLGPAYFGLCPFTNATAVSLSSGATQPHVVNFVLQSNDPIFANGFE